jgi:hypothetical protein
MRIARGKPVLWLMLSTAAIVLAACSRSQQGVVLLESTLTAAPLLKSEAERIAIPVRIDAPIVFENIGDEARTLKVSKTGCKCYGIAIASRALEPDEALTIPPGQRRELYFLARLSETTGDQTFRAAFTVDDGSTLSAECSMKVLADVELEPSSFALDVTDVASKPGKSLELTIRRTVRGTVESLGEPGIATASESLRLQAIRRDEAAVEISPGIWRSAWKATLELGEIPGELRENGGRIPFQVEFPDAAAGPRSPPQTAGEGRVPTPLEVVDPRPLREATGHVVLRRTKGIVAPAQIHFGVIRPGQPRSRRIVLTAADRLPFRIESTDASEPWGAEIDSDADATQQWLTVTLAAPAEPGEIERRLVVKTTHPSSIDLSIVLKARVQE